MRIFNLLCCVAAMTIMIVCADASDRRGKKSDCGGNCNSAACSNANAPATPAVTQAPAPTSTAQDCPCANCCKVDKNGVVTMKSLKLDRLQIGEGIAMQCFDRGGGAGIWLTSPKVPGMVSIYIIEGQGPCIGIHRNKNLTGPKGQDGYDLALALNKGEPSIQFRKTDGSFGWLTAKELEAAIKK